MLRNYFKITRRNLLKDRGYSLLNLVGLYIGFVSLILTAVYLNDEFGYDVHHPNVEQTYRLLDISGNTGIKGSETAAPWAPALKEQFPEISEYVRILGHGNTVFEFGEHRFYEGGGIYADGEILSVFSYDMRLGDPKTALDEPYQMVITERLAMKYFGTNNPIGEVIRIDGDKSYTITGVLADDQKSSHLNFNFVASFDSHNNWFKTDWVMENYTTYLHLSEGTDIASLEDKMTDFFDTRHPSTETEYNNAAGLQPITDIHLYDDSNNQNPSVSQVLLFGVIGTFILIIALFNYVNLVTARSTKRLKEVGVRKSIGANKRQLIIQFLAENFIVCFIVFALAIVSFKAFLPGFNDLIDANLSFSWRANYLLILGLFLITIIVSLISGFYPAMVLSTLKPANLIKDNTGLHGGKNHLRKILTTFQFVISIALIIGTALVYRQLQFMLNKDIGFDKEQVLVVPLGNSSLRNTKEVFANQIRELPQVKGVALSANSMGGGDWGMPFRYELGQDPLSVRFMALDENYREVLGLRLLEGRFFSKDLVTDVENSYIVNKAFLAATGWETAVGKRIDMPSRDPENPWNPGVVVGVVDDFNFRSLHSGISPMVIANRVEWTGILFIKLNTGETDQVLTEIQQIWDEAETGFPFGHYFLEDQVGRFYEPEKRLSKIAIVFGSIALVLACIGLFSLSTYMAEQRMKEVSIRKVMGASMNQIWTLFSKEFVQIILISTAIAIPLSLFYLDGWLSTFAFRIEVWKNLEIPILAALSTLIIAMLTIAIQSIRLTRANPVKFLRSE